MKIINDTLKNPKNGEYSRKSIILFVSFNFVMLYEGVLPIVAEVIKLWLPALEFQTKQYVFEAMLLFVATLLGITVWDKKQKNQ